MFCSTECRDEFYKCADLSSKEFNILKFLLKKIEIAFGGQKKLNKYLKKNLSCSIFDFDFSDQSHPDYWRNIYKCFFSAQPLELLNDWEGWIGNNYDETTKKLLFHVFRNMMNNSISNFFIEHKSKSFDESKKYLRRHDSVYYTLDKLQSFTTFRALLNHSCVANIACFYLESTAIFYVKTPIKANEQLFINYV
jgi:hypothetical protein